MVVLDLGVQTCQVEAIGQVVLVDLAEVFVAARRDELGRAGGQRRYTARWDGLEAKARRSVGPR